MNPTNMLLDRNFRQELDVNFQVVLRDIRVGQLRPSSVEFLSRLHTSSDELPQNMLRILPLKKDVDAFNLDTIRGLPQYRTIPPKLHFRGYFSLKHQHYWLSQLEHIFPMKNCHVAIGARIVLCSNVKGLRSQGLVNGSFGFIRGIHSDYLTCEFDDLPQQLVYVTRHTFHYFTGYMQCFIDMTQFPVLPAWALTVHKVQGLTIKSHVAIQCQHSFEYGQVYTALSRVIQSTQIHIIDRNMKDSKVAEDVEEIKDTEDTEDTEETKETKETKNLKETVDICPRKHISHWIKTFHPAQVYESNIRRTFIL